MSVQALRLYERKGLLEPTRTSGGTRRYSDTDIARLRRISVLIAEGINLTGIARVLGLEADNADLHADNAGLRTRNTALTNTNTALRAGDTELDAENSAPRPRATTPFAALTAQVLRREHAVFSLKRPHEAARWFPDRAAGLQPARVALVGLRAAVGSVTPVLRG